MLQAEIKKIEQMLSKETDTKMIKLYKDILKKEKASISVKGYGKNDDDMQRIADDIKKNESKTKKVIKKALKKKSSKKKSKPSEKDITSLKKQIKQKTGKTEAECIAIVEQYKALRDKAQKRKKSAEKSSKKVAKETKQGKRIDGKKTASTIIRETTKKTAPIINKEIDKVGIKKETDRLFKETKILVDSIKVELSKYDKMAGKDYLLRLRKEIDKLLKQKFGGGGFTSPSNIQEGMISVGNNAHFETGGDVFDGSGDSINFGGGGFTSPSNIQEGMISVGNNAHFETGGRVSYNGWTNYATWVTNLEILDGMDWKDYNMGEPISSEQVKDYVEQVMEESPELAVSFANRFLNDVNYYEIVEHINDEFDLDDGEKDEYSKGGSIKGKKVVRFHYEVYNNPSRYKDENPTMYGDKDDPYRIAFEKGLEKAEKDKKDGTYEFFRGNTPSKLSFAKGGSINAKYLNSISNEKREMILSNIAKHYGTSISKIKDEVNDEDAEKLYEYIANDNKLRMEVYNSIEKNYAKGGGVDGLHNKVSLNLEIKKLDRKRNEISTKIRGLKNGSKEQEKMMSELQKIGAKMNELIDIKQSERGYAKGGMMQGYNDRADEGLGNRNGRGSNHKQNYKDRRDEMKGENRASGNKTYGMFAKGGMTISKIKELSSETSPYFFDRKSMKMFGQSMSDFKVKKMNDGRYKISAPSYSTDYRTGDRKRMGETIRYFNTDNNKLELR